MTFDLPPFYSALESEVGDVLWLHYTLLRTFVRYFDFSGSLAHCLCPFSPQNIVKFRPLSSKFYTRQLGEPYAKKDPLPPMRMKIQ